MPELFRPWPLAAVSWLALLVAGCGGLLATPYAPPQADVPESWSQTGQAAGQAAGQTVGQTGDQALGAPASLLDWSLGVEELADLVREALARNSDLAAAGVSVRRAVLVAGLAQDALHPQPGAGASTGLDQGLGRGGATARSYQLSSSVSWEADLWGRLASELDAARWTARASAEDREATALSLVGTVVNLYWKLAYVNERLGLSRESIDYAARSLDLAKAQYLSGAASSLDVVQAEQALASQRAAHEEFLQERVETRNALGILLGGAPGRLGADPDRLPRLEPPQVQAGIPAQVLGRRPDLRAAELRLKSLLADVDATRGSYYPPLTLTGALGTASDKIQDILKNPVGALAASLTLPFLRYREMRLAVAVSRADYDLAVEEFRSTLYQALAEVEDALSARRRLAERGRLLAQSAVAASRAERIYEIRYRSGQTAIKDWLDAQQTRREAEAALLANRLDRLQNITTIRQALGGNGFEWPPGASEGLEPGDDAEARGPGPDQARPAGARS